VVVDVSVLLSPPLGEAVVLEECSLVVLVLVLEPPPAGEGFTIVVLFSVFVPGDAPGVVSTRCSHAPKSAALAMMQMYFVISR
jgi:hypothetical protein